MVSVLYFPWKMTHFDVCCLLSLYLLVLFLDDSCDFVIRLDRFEARRRSSCSRASLAFAFSFHANRGSLRGEIEMRFYPRAFFMGMLLVSSF